MGDVADLKVTRYLVEAGVALVTLDRPDRLNAWTARMQHEYRLLMERAAADSAVRVIVVTGAGRGFCAGADTEALRGLAAGEPYPAEPAGTSDARAPRPFDHPLAFPLGIPKPVIAAVNGPAAGVGFVLMCFADMRFAAAGAKLTTSFARLGLPAEHGVSWMLPRLVGPSRAADLLFSSRVVLAEEALSLGLVDRVFSPETLLDETLAYARAMATDVAPSSLAAIKGQLWHDTAGDLEGSTATAGRLLAEMLGSDDFREGVAALRERRPPRFAG